MGKGLELADRDRTSANEWQRIGVGASSASLAVRPARCRQPTHVLLKFCCEISGGGGRFLRAGRGNAARAGAGGTAHDGSFADALVFSGPRAHRCRRHAATTCGSSPCSSCISGDTPLMPTLGSMCAPRFNVCTPQDVGGIIGFCGIHALQSCVAGDDPETNAVETRVACLMVSAFQPQASPESATHALDACARARQLC